jgi:hypothetical protein
VDGHDRIAGVVLAGEERVLLHALELVLDGRELRLDLLAQISVEREELPRVLVVADESLVTLKALAQARVLGRDLGCVLLVIPEARLPEFLLELDNSAAE